MSAAVATGGPRATVIEAERHTHSRGNPAAFACGANVGRLADGEPTCPHCSGRSATFARTIRILVCGSRDWKAIDEIGGQMPETDPDVDVVIIHGAAQGADRLAGIVAHGLAHRVEEFPADWERDGKAAGPKRNARMLADSKPDRGLAFGALWRLAGIHGPHAAQTWKRTGTGDMVAKMLRAGLPVRWMASPDTPAVDLTAMPEPP